ncbi:hypothetical protein TNCV_3204121 [Trichonephila clavipes]|nr:hypothetical protein TNCV_3204121 [Trichonephila clavipes]
MEEVVGLSRQINLKMDRDDFPELRDSHSHELTIDELIEMHEQEQDIVEPILQLDFHDVTTGTPARAPQSLSPLFSQWSKFLFHIGSAAPACEDCVLCFVERFNWMTTPQPIPQRLT